MIDRIKPLLLVLVISVSSGQVITMIDTIHGVPGQQEFYLKYSPVIDLSCQVFIDGHWRNDVKIDHIEGRFSLDFPLQDSTTVYASYTFSTLSLPKRVGPLALSLPLLDSIYATGNLPVTPVSDRGMRSPDPDHNILSTGNVYRHIQINPGGGTSIGGGLQIQLQGNLSEDIHVNGILTDRQTGIQPEGNTRELDDFDRIYLQVSHQHLNIMAGDIDYNLSLDRNFEISRRLTGLKQSFRYKNTSGSSVFGGSNGIFSEMDFHGSDGNQGPYQLRSKTGSSDIIILSGTEKVYLDGVLMTRGENHDYTIDYSLGELSFTPRNMIEFDSDIHVEYQYSDFQYSRNTIGGAFTTELSSDSKVTIGWIREYDQIDDRENRFSEDLLDSIKAAGDGDLIISSAIPDSGGQYILQNGIYVYSESPGTDTKYGVSFQIDPEGGEYVRKISDRGELFYVYLPENERTDRQDLYSPDRRIVVPTSKDILYLGGNVNLTPLMNIRLALSTSLFDQNILSKIDDRNNSGTDYTVSLSGNTGPLKRIMSLDYQVEYWNRSKEFSPLQRDRKINFIQDWDLPDDISTAESEFRSRIEVTGEKGGNLASGYSVYTFGNEARQRLENDLFLSRGFVHVLKMNQNLVTGAGNRFERWRSRLELFQGPVHPFISGEYEESRRNYRFHTIGAGLNAAFNSYTGAVSLGSRSDFINADESGDEMIRTGKSYYGSLQLRGRSGGLFQEIEFRKRIKDFISQNSTLDYELLRLKINYYNPRAPLRMDLQSKLEETLTETRAVVYDSVGQGLGQFRYDPVFNEFVEDPNGPYRSYTVFSGNRQPATHFTNSLRTQWQFKKSGSRILKDITINGNLKTEYNGGDFSPGNVFNYTLEDDLLRAYGSFYLEGLYKKSGLNRRIRLRLLNNRNLNGLDPRGNSLTTGKEMWIEYQEQIFSQLISVNRFEIHSGEKTSSVLNTRPRKFSGWNSEIGIKISGNTDWRLEWFLQRGVDAGVSSGNRFTAEYYGSKTQITRFVGKKGRIEMAAEWNNGSTTVKYFDLPPEVLKNVTPGENIRIQLMGQYLIGEYFSLNTNLSLIDNLYYDRYVAVTGELRAYF